MSEYLGPKWTTLGRSDWESEQPEKWSRTTPPWKNLKKEIIFVPAFPWFGPALDWPRAYWQLYLLGQASGSLGPVYSSPYSMQQPHKHIPEQTKHLFTSIIHRGPVPDKAAERLEQPVCQHVRGHLALQQKFTVVSSAIVSFHTTW